VLGIRDIERMATSSKVSTGSKGSKLTETPKESLWRELDFLSLPVDSSQWTMKETGST
jgi:hypothetical protein